MFLLEALFVVLTIYSISSLIAEVVMHSEAEMALPFPIRAGFGFLISLVYFSAACLLVSATQAWLIGTVLLLLIAIGNGFFTQLSSVRQRLLPFIKSACLYVLVGVIFFLPSVMSHNYGPFTEGGGDISIYADTAKFLQDHHLTELGLSSDNLSDVMRNFKQVVQPKSLEERWDTLNHALINPPAAESAAYRVIATQDLNIFFSLPYVTYGFLSHETNYAMYFGIQAFFYACMLSGIWCFFRRFNVTVAAIATLLAMGSYAVISVFYNMYSMQANCLATSALVLAILPTVRLPSREGFRTYGSAFLNIWLSYIHFLSVVLPLMVGVALFIRHKKVKSLTHYKFSVLTGLVATLFVVSWLFAAWVGSEKSLGFLHSLFSEMFSHTKSIYRGDGLSIFSFQWLSFLFGFVSQQHFYPYAAEFAFIHKAIGLGIIAGIVTLMTGGMIMLRILFSPFSLQGRKKLYLTIYLLAVITVVVHAYLAHQSLYNQAKGAQNVMIYFYTVMLLPFALGGIALQEGLKIKRLLSLFSAGLTTFVIVLVVSRMAYTTKLAFGQDRGSILETSYFTEAKRIKQTDPDALVLVEPRKSADLYISIQPFFGSRMMTTRHLGLQTETFHPEGWVKQAVLASDLIQSKDWSHLWVLSSTCHEKTSWVQERRCAWSATKVIDHQAPTVLFFADDYDRHFGVRNISDDGKETGMFSFLRNGASILYVPTGGGTVDAIMQPRDENGYAAMLKEVAERFSKAEFGKDVRLVSDGKNIKLIYRLPNNVQPVFKLIARFNGEYWLDVKLNGREV